MNILLFILLLGLTLIASAFILWPLWPTRKLWIAILVLFFLSAAALTYQYLGAFKILKAMEHAKRMDAQEDEKIQAMGGEKVVVEKLKAHLQEHPSEAQGWYLLGRIYLSQNHLDDASLCFTKAHKLEPKRMDITIALADVSYAQGQYQKAIGLWQTLLTQMPANSDAAKALEAAIAKAKEAANP